MKKNLIKNEDGYVLVISLILLGLLSLLGIASTDTATLEVQIAANSRTYTRNFYKAETAVREALARVINRDNIQAWRTPNTIDMTNIDNWENPNANPVNSEIIDDDGITRYAVIGPVNVSESGAVTGTNQTEDMAQSITQVYYLYGYYNKDSEPDRGRVLIEMGYRLKIDAD